MKKAFILFPLVFIGVIFYVAFSSDLELLYPQGAIAVMQRNLIITAVLVMLIIVIPVLSSLVYVSFKYRDKKKNDYEPEKTYSISLQLLWWVGPVVIIAIIAGMIWRYTHLLDPYKPISSSTPSLKIQVVALNWKWLFIYPEQNIATVNYLEFPVGTPLEFELTSDGPMNSFWIPSLGGQMYAMTGMVTTLHLVANNKGTFTGKAAEINGNGYAGMTFEARSVREDEFSRWVTEIKKSNQTLDRAQYTALLRPSSYVPPSVYSLGDKNLYNTIVQKYLPPPSVGTIED